MQRKQNLGKTKVWTILFRIIGHLHYSTFILNFTGDLSVFEINARTGWISVVSSLDRDAEDVKQKGGVYTMVVMVSTVDVLKCPSPKFLTKIAYTNSVNQD